VVDDRILNAEREVPRDTEDRVDSDLFQTTQNMLNHRLRHAFSSIGFDRVFLGKQVQQRRIDRVAKPGHD
jgi:hypothetical protein